jgi:hypothetical protein
MKIIAWYLPQFHEIEENNNWWGQGFTEWNNVKSAQPQFRRHEQPRIPLNNNYYNLLDEKTQIWQAELAQKYGIYGFCYYHYWSNGRLLLEKPAENMLANKKITIPFCFSWANHTWRRTWGTYSKEVLLEQEYGDREEWKAHFDYLLPFFKDERYIKDDNRPIFIIYQPRNIKNLHEMTELWNQLAKANGWKGICFISQDCRGDITKEKEMDHFSFNVEYQPDRAKQKLLRKPAYLIKRFLNQYCNYPVRALKVVFDYDRLWKIILKQKPMNEFAIPGAFVDWDNSPRYGKYGTMCIGMTPQKFEKYLSIQIKRAKTIYNSSYLFLFAWNEWGECGYLEPDEKNQYQILEAVKSATERNL